MKSSKNDLSSQFTPDMRKILIICPVYNDWESFFETVKSLDRILIKSNCRITIHAINDGSSLNPDPPADFANIIYSIEEIEIIHLNCNLGHQRAIAVGLSDAINRKSFDAVLVMDADGEDRPEDVITLIQESQRNPDVILVARRDKRSEGSIFRIGYFGYKLIFRILTGVKIKFGNFCLIPYSIAKRLIYHDHLWNHLAATLLRSKLPMEMISTQRGSRYAGKSKMNTLGLILQGLSAMAVYVDLMLLRTLIFSLAVGALTLIGIIAVVAIRFFTELAIPGWASSVAGFLSIILIQTLMITLGILFGILASRNQKTFIPARHSLDFVERHEKILLK